MEEHRKALERLVKKQIQIWQKITPDRAIAAMMDFYQTHQILQNVEEPDHDMLLFQYGIYDWTGKRAAFEFNLTRQVADPDPEEEGYIQFRLTPVLPTRRPK